MNILTYIGYLFVAVIVCFIFGVIVYVLSQKSRNKFEEVLKTIPDEKKAVLINTPYEPVPDLPNGVIVMALIYEMKQKSNGGLSLNAMFYNTYYPNFREQLMDMNVTVSAKEAKGHELKNYDFIKVLLNEDKNPKIVF